MDGRRSEADSAAREVIDLILAFPSLPSHIHPQAARESDEHLDRSLNIGSDLADFLEEDGTLLLKFLHEVDAANELALYSHEGMGRAVQRYETCWLPLLAQHRGVRHMAPPLDVAWAWLMHTLAPSKYAADFQLITGMSASDIQARSPQHREPAAIAATQRLWEAAYGEGTFEPSPFSSGRRGMQSTTPEISYKQKSTYDLQAAAARQEVFLYQVSLPHWRTKWFIQKCVRRYLAFLTLRRDHLTTFLVPTYDIDLIWHAHMAGHSRYVRDMLQLTGASFNHDDSVNDRSSGGKLENGYHATAELWQEAFKQRYAFEGAMYRGQLPPTVLAQFNRLTRRTPQKTKEVDPEEASTLAGKGPCQLDFGTSTRSEHGDDCITRAKLRDGDSDYGTVFTRVPLTLRGRSACILVRDCQGVLRAVSRVLPRTHLPRRDAGARRLRIPLYDEPHSFIPPFLIQSCEADGRSRDWAIMQLEWKGKTADPWLYSLEESSGLQEMGKASCQGTADAFTNQTGITCRRVCATAVPEEKKIVKEPRRKNSLMRSLFICGTVKRSQRVQKHLIADWQQCCQVKILSFPQDKDQFCRVAAAATSRLLYHALKGPSSSPQ